MDSEIVSTECGRIKGKCTKLVDGTPVYTFRNVPYAKSPTGSLRFMPPERVEPWEGVRDGTVSGNIPMFPSMFDGLYEAVIPQISVDDATPVHNEDCLHLTVYSPKIQRGSKLPVLVWLYGGGFQMGSERDYIAWPLSGMGDVVVVVPNYRVGILGFLSLGRDSVCTGNAGLMDQQQALRWVRDHIEDFGGDKTNVTLIGESAGANSVHMHLVSPLSRGLFHKAVSQSGQVFMEEGFQTEEKRKRAIESLLTKLKIEERDNVRILEALQSIPAQTLVDLSAALMGEQLQFTPIIDGKVFEGSVVESIKKKDFAKLPYIIGCNSTEGQGVLTQFSGANFLGGLSEEEAKRAVFFPLSDEGFELCKKEYLCNDHGDTKFSRLVGDIVGNGLFIAPAVQAANIHSDAGANVYAYVATFQLKMHHDERFGEKVAKKAPWCECDHGDDVYMTFGAPFYPQNLPRGAKFSEEERELSREFITYISNFARTGDPNQGKPVKVQWPRFRAGGEHLVLGTPITTKAKFGEKSAKFWSEVMTPHLTSKSSFIPTPKA